MLTNKEVLENREKFISILRSIKREGCDIEGLISKLDNSDFFTAPASTQYHCSFEGGLCYHSLNVYEQLIKLIDMEYPRMVPGEDGEMMEVDNYTCPISEDTIKIVALLHDFSKMNTYETVMRNVKDESGNWVKVPFIKTKEAKDRFMYGPHGVTSEYMTGRFIPLTVEESVAIINHMGGKEAGSNGFDPTLSEIFNRYPLSILLHTADMLATFLIEAI